ncbi:MAG: glycoside hydrolase family 19 protein [Gammaproteobacteria bacterium]
MNKLKLEDLMSIMPSLTRDRALLFMDPLNDTIAQFHLPVAKFLGQIAVESGNLAHLSENLNYSAAGLMRTWPHRFPVLELALHYERNPERIANYVYADRMGNGNAASGDGWRYRGSGLIQLTGRFNQEACGNVFGLNVELVPDWLRSPRGGSLSAGWFWNSRNLNAIASRQAPVDVVVKALTKSINGGTHGLQARLDVTLKAMEVLGLVLKP